MIIPVRCFTCNKVIAHLDKKFTELQNAEMPNDIIFQELGIRRICCKRMFLTSLDVCEHLGQYTELPANVSRTATVDTTRVYRAR